MISWNYLQFLYDIDELFQAEYPHLREIFIFSVNFYEYMKSFKMHQAL